MKSLGRIELRLTSKFFGSLEPPPLTHEKCCHNSRELPICSKMLFALPRIQKWHEKSLEQALEERQKKDVGFPEIAEEDEKFDPDDNPQMTMEARS